MAPIEVWPGSQRSTSRTARWWIPSSAAVIHKHNCPSWATAMSCCYSGASVMGACAFGYYPYISRPQTMEAVSGERMVPLPASLPKEGMGIFIVHKACAIIQLRAEGSVYLPFVWCAAPSNSSKDATWSIQLPLNHGESTHFTVMAFQRKRNEKCFMLDILRNISTVNCPAFFRLIIHQTLSS